MANNTQNLLRPEDLTSEQLRERASKGGKASVEAKRKKKSLRELCGFLMSSKVANNSVKKKIADFFPELSMDDIDYATAMSVAQIHKAIKGDSKAFEVMRDTSGQKPVDKKDFRSSDGTMSPSKMNFITAEEAARAYHEEMKSSDVGA